MSDESHKLAGMARKLVFSWCGNPGVGSLHRIRDALERGEDGPGLRERDPLPPEHRGERVADLRAQGVVRRLLGIAAIISYFPGSEETG